MKRRNEKQSESSEWTSFLGTSDEPFSKEIRIALMEDHRWTITETDKEIILRLDIDLESGSDESSIHDLDTTVVEISDQTTNPPERRTSAATAHETRTVEGVEDCMAVDQDPRTPLGSFGFEIFRKMIDYIIVLPRVFFCYEAITWREFREAHYDIRDDYTCEELRDMFITKILPKVFSFNLPEATKKAFNILDLSASFERIKTGYFANPLAKYAAANISLKRGIDYQIVDARTHAVGSCGPIRELNCAAENAKFTLDTQKSDPAPPQIAIVVGDSNFFQNGKPQRPTALTAKNMSILSAIVSYDYELYNSTSHTPITLAVRLQEIREEYERSGRLPESFNSHILKKKINEFLKLKEMIVDIADSRFSMDKMETA